MKRTTADGHDSNSYTSGNPSLGIPATVVGADEMQNLQEEIALTVEEAGLTVDQTGVTKNQLQQAIKILIEGGGTTEAGMTLADNQAAATDVTAIPAFDKTKTKSVSMLVDLFRRNDSKSANELYELCAIYDPEGDAWSLSFTSKGDDAAVVFSITSAGQIQYTSDAYAGTGYTGKLRVSHVKKISIAL